jgi:hypothetical protein
MRGRDEAIEELKRRRPRRRLFADRVAPAPTPPSAPPSRAASADSAPADAADRAAGATDRAADR